MRHPLPKNHRSSAPAIALVATFVLATATAGYTGYRINDSQCDSYFSTATPSDIPTAQPVPPDDLSGDAFPDWSERPVNRALDHAEAAESPWGELLGVMPRTVATDADIPNMQLHPIPVALNDSTLHYVTEVNETPAVAAMNMETNSVDWAVKLPKGAVWPTPVLPATDSPAVILQDTDSGAALAGIDATGRVAWCEYVTNTVTERDIYRLRDDVLLLTHGSESSQLTRLDGTTGQTNWQTTLPSDSRLTTASITDDVILTHTTESITAIAPTGEVEWSHTPVTATPDDYAHIIGVADATPVVVTATMGTQDVPEAAAVYGLSPTGEPRWNRDLDPEMLGGYSWMDWEDNFLRANLDDAIHIVDSTLLITTPDKTDRDGRVTWATTRGTIHAFDLTTGTEQWTTPVDHDLRLSESLELAEQAIAIPLGPGPATTDNVVDGLVTLDTSTGAVGERYLDRMWIGPYVGTGSFISDSFAIVSSIDLLLVYRR